VSLALQTKKLILTDGEKWAENKVGFLRLQVFLFLA
jgi:hypothetical protein